MDEIRVPSWLTGDSFDFSISNILEDSCYYPYGNLQGSPVKQLIKKAYSFVFVEYTVSESELLREIEEHGFKGYRAIHIQDIPESLLTPNGLADFVRPRSGEDSVQRKVDPFCKWFIFENPTDGLRFSFLFLAADAIAAYQALYFSNNVQPRFLVFVYPRGDNREHQDHWRELNKPHGFFERVLSTNRSCSPKYISFDNHNDCWSSYSEFIEDIFVNYHIYGRSD